MATKVIISRVDTASNFTTANPTLALGEMGWEQDTNRIKVGDGSTAWNSLSYRFEVVTDHGSLNAASLLDDDHPQYHNDTRGDIRYYTQTQLDSGQLDSRYYTETEIDTLIEKTYFQASQTSVQLAISSSDTDLVSVQNQNSNTSVFSFNGTELTINKTSTFKFDINITGDTNTGSRETLRARLQRDTGSGYADIPTSEAHTEGFSYHRNTDSGEDTIDISPIISVTSGDKFKIVLNSPTNGVNTVPVGTGFTVEEK